MVTGLPTGAALVLSNEGADSTSVATNGIFTFPTPIASGSQYAVAVATPPANDTCVVNNATGTIASANVTNVSINCSPTTYTIGGSVSGLASGTSVVLLDNGGDSITVASNTNFTFKTAITTGSSYSVSVGTQPANQKCTVSGSSGMVSAANVAGITVSCAPAFTIGGTVTGLAAGTSITLQDNGSDATVVSSNGAFTFPTAITAGTQYAVTVSTQPAYQGCSVVAGTGQAVANVTNVQVRCPVFTLLENLGVGTVGSSAQSLHILSSDGNFYGTTEYGGLYVGGTVYKLTPDGNISTIANFVNGTTSWGPMGALLQAADGNFYGTTYWGGVNNAGTIYKLAPDGTITTLWSFGSGADGEFPKGGLVQASDGNFYGTTGSGGTTGYGTVFRLTPGGVETVIWNFSMDSGGYFPEGALVVGGDGNLYGAASFGGTNSDGVVFKVTLAGVESVVWNFGGSLEGGTPAPKLIIGSDGNLYGTTKGGGANGGGTLFKLTLDGMLSVVWAFGAGTDGAEAWTGVTQGIDGNFYGTTIGGGTIKTCGLEYDYGCGTVFRVTPDGQEIVLWDFGFGGNGAAPFPLGVVQNADGSLFGVNWIGGPSGGGTIYQLTQ
jgi:uncharacterized repeat protein (TIGR03803 family)